MVRTAICLVLALGILPQARADVGPPQPAPPAPGTITRATIAGIDLEQEWTYFRGRRWMVRVTGCADPETGACKALTGCYIVGVGGNRIEDGDLEAVVRHAESTEGPLAVTTDGCGDGGEITIPR
ncbi:MAG: hypothetical protein PHS60_08195 [Zavarzinia sp.]|nr:hypothetical protein [Zavarzinia sp.]